MKHIKRISFLSLFLMGGFYLQMCGMETTYKPIGAQTSLLNKRELPPLVLDRYLIGNNDLQKVLKNGLTMCFTGKHQTREGNVQGEKKLINIVTYNAATQAVLEAQVGWYKEVLQKKDASFEIEQPMCQMTECKELSPFKKIGQNDLILLSKKSPLLKEAIHIFDACQVKKATLQDGQEKKVADVSALHSLLASYNPEIKRLDGELNDLRSKFALLKKEEKQRIMRSHQNPRFIDHVNELIGDEPWRDTPDLQKSQGAPTASKFNGLFTVFKTNMFSKTKSFFFDRFKKPSKKATGAQDDLD